MKFMLFTVLLQVLICQTLGQINPEPEISEEDECRQAGSLQGTCPEGQVCELVSQCPTTPRAKRQLLPPPSLYVDDCALMLKCLPDLDECDDEYDISTRARNPKCPKGQKCELSDECIGDKNSNNCRFYRKCFVDKDECTMFYDYDHGETESKGCAPGLKCESYQDPKCAMNFEPTDECKLYNKCVKDKDECSPFDDGSPKPKCGKGKICKQRPDPSCETEFCYQSYYQCITDINECGFFGWEDKPACPRGQSCRSASETCVPDKPCYTKLVCYPDTVKECGYMPGEGGIGMPLQLPQMNSMFGANGKRRKRQMMPPLMESVECQRTNQCKMVKIDLPDSFHLLSQVCVPNAARSCTSSSACNATEKCVEVDGCDGCYPVIKKCVRV